MQRYAVRYLVACALLVAAAGGSSVLGRARSHAKASPPDWAHVPLTCGAWQGREEKVDPTIKKYLAAEQMLARSYTRSGLRVGFSATFGTQWRSLHSPAGCYPSQGWQTISRRPVTIPFDGAPGFAGPLRAEELFVEKSQNYRLVLYLYVFPGGTTANWVEQCLRVARSGVGGGGVVLILDAPASLESRGQVEKDLSDLLTSIFPHVVRGWGNGAAG